MKCRLNDPRPIPPFLFLPQTSHSHVALCFFLCCCCDEGKKRTFSRAGPMTGHPTAWAVSLENAGLSGLGVDAKDRSCEFFVWARKGQTALKR